MVERIEKMSCLKAQRVWLMLSPMHAVHAECAWLVMGGQAKRTDFSTGRQKVLGQLLPRGTHQIAILKQCGIVLRTSFTDSPQVATPPPPPNPRGSNFGDFLPEFNSRIPSQVQFRFCTILIFSDGESFPPKLLRRLFPLQPFEVNASNLFCGGKWSGHWTPWKLVDRPQGRSPPRLRGFTRYKCLAAVEVGRLASSSRDRTPIPA